MNDEAKLKTAKRIADLLKKAEATGVSQNEAEAFTQMAQKLMTQRNIDRFMVESAMGRNDRSPKAVTKIRIDFTGVYAKVYVLMAHSVAQGMNRGFKGFILNMGKSDRTYEVYGMPEDLEDLKILVQSIQIQLAIAMNRHMKEHELAPWMTPSEKYNERRSFIIGYGDGVQLKLASAQREAVAEAEASSAGSGSGYQLELRNNAQLVEQHVADNVKVSKRKTQGVKLTSGYGYGMQAGRNSDTGDKRVSNGNAAVEG